MIVVMLEIIEIYWWYISVENNENYLLKILSTEICLKWLFYIRDCWELIKLGYKLCFVIFGLLGIFLWYLGWYSERKIVILVVRNY